MIESVKKKLFILLVSCSIISCWFLIRKNEMSILSSEKKLSSDAQRPLASMTVEKRAIESSMLGEWLHAPEETTLPALNAESALNPKKRYLILMWKHGPFLDRRHVRHFAAQKSDSLSPWRGCSAQNCDLSYRDEDLARADAVIFHLHMTKGIDDLPATRGKPDQIWIFLTDESPLHTFLYADKNRNISQYDGIFDWSMSYRENSDVPVPYGRTFAKKNVDDNETRRQSRKRRNKLVAILGSNCSGNNRRWEYVTELKRVLGEKLDIYGGCLGGNRTACPGHFDKDCPILSAYKFYLAFENSNCREYITEKVFWNAYEKGSVPVIMGAPLSDCEQLLPPRSFIHVSDFASPSSLARYLLYLDNVDDAYDEYQEWRSKYVVVNEHGYFGSVSKHYCRVCEALRYNIRPSKLPKYQRIGDFLNASRDCYPYS